MWQEFKAFISRGNVVDLAVGLIMGVAFTAIVNSLVNDIIMPPFGWAMGRVDFSDLYLNLSGGEYPSLAAAKEAGAATVNYGTFINTIINFVIVGFAVFLLVKAVNRLRRREAAAPSLPPAPTRSEVLLEEIRDLLRRGPA